MLLLIINYYYNYYYSLWEWLILPYQGIREQLEQKDSHTNKKLKLSFHASRHEPLFETQYSSFDVTIHDERYMKLIWELGLVSRNPIPFVTYTWSLYIYNINIYKLDVLHSYVISQMRLISVRLSFAFSLSRRIPHLSSLCLS